MTHSLEERAAAVVAEMVDLGAKFEISESGLDGLPRWHWEPHPEVMRHAIRRVWTAVVDRNAPGFDAAMVAAIGRLHSAGPA